MLILNEKKYAKSVYDGKNIEIKSIMSKLRYVTRYLLYAENKNDEENYKATVEWMKEYHDNFDESCYSNLISDAIKKAHKYPFYNIENIKITKSELNIISSLDNLRAEKVLFVLLCMAKQQSISNGFTNGLVKYSITELCKTARISVPADEREYILYDIVQKGFIGYPKKNDTQCLIVNFINDDDEEILTLDEDSCKELAYIYLEWKNGGDGYSRCEYCKRPMKQSKKSPKRFCEACSVKIGDIPDDMKVVSCVDCGELVYVSKFDNETVRCEECRIKHLQKIRSGQNKRYYQQRKIQ